MQHKRSGSEYHDIDVVLADRDAPQEQTVHIPKRAMGVNNCPKQQTLLQIAFSDVNACVMYD